MYQIKWNRNYQGKLGTSFKFNLKNMHASMKHVNKNFVQSSKYFYLQ